MRKLAAMAIPLTQGFFALVDGNNYKWLNKYKWCAIKNGRTYYAARNIRQKGKNYMLFMHREILGLHQGDGRMSDHRNHCGLDNREVNIRACSHQQNHHNNQLQSNNTSGYKGVSWSNRNKKWRADIKNNGVHLYLGSFSNKKEAAKAYDKKAKELFGEYALPNF